MDNILPYLPHLILLCLGVILMFKAQKDKKHKFNIFDYFLDENGKTSTSKTLQIVAGITSTWIVVKMTIMGTLTYEILGLYMAAFGIAEGWSKYNNLKFKKNK